MPLGEPMPMVDAEARVRGTLPYTVNLRFPYMLVAKILRSPYPHARITALRVEEAERMPGVAAVLTAADFDGPGKPRLIHGLTLKDQPVVAKDRVRYVGEPVAAVAAESLEAAEAAVEAIEVEYEELPAVFDPVEATQEGAPILHEAYPDNRFVHTKLRYGDVEKGFEQADLIVEETYTIPVAQHAFLEPHATIARWEGDHLTVWTTSQAPYRVRQVLMEVFDLPPERVRVIVPPLGGGYGGKGYANLEPLVAALAAKVPGRPVKLVVPPTEEFVTITRHASRITIRTGVTREGRITARQVTAYFSSGAYARVTPVLLRTALVRLVGPYRIPNVRVDVYGVYTNLPPTGPFRGTMSTEGAWAYESHMDTIARRLGMDPLELRRRNLLRSGDEFYTGEVIEDIHFDECLEAVAECLGWDKPFDRGQGPKRRGRGLAVMIKSTIATSRSECRVVLHPDGRLDVYTSTVEMGQGTHTGLAQLAAAAWGTSLDHVRIVGPDTAQTPFDTTTSASRAAYMMGRALLDAVEQLKARLREAAAPLLEEPPEKLDVHGSEVFVREQPEHRVTLRQVFEVQGWDHLETVGAYETQGGLDPETGQGKASPHWHQGAGACEVEVDTETGQVRILKYCASAYAGQVINPLLAHLQNDGNVVFGIGTALMEEVVFDHGQPTNANLSDYAIPALGDMPEVWESVLVEHPGAEIHGIGEMALPPVAPAIANAIFDAIGVRVYDLPITPEKIVRALSHGEKGDHASH